MKCPKTNELVTFRVQNVTELGILVFLLQYPQTQAMICEPEYGRRRLSTNSQKIRTGQLGCAFVARVDTGKGFVDLSRRRPTPEEARECLKYYVEPGSIWLIFFE